MVSSFFIHTIEFCQWQDAVVRIENNEMHDKRQSNALREGWDD